MKNSERNPKAPRLVVRVIRIGEKVWRGEGASEAEAFRTMRPVENGKE